MTADEVRAWAAEKSARGMLGDISRRRLIDGVERAIAAGGGSGAVGAFTVGIAAGQELWAP